MSKIFRKCRDRLIDNFEVKLFMIEKVLYRNVPVSDSQVNSYDGLIIVICFVWFLHLHKIVEGLYCHRSLSVCLSGSACEQNSSQTDEPIWTLNGCLPHWLEPYWIWWPWVKGQDHSDVIPIFSSLFSVNFPTLYLSSLMFYQN